MKETYKKTLNKKIIVSFYTIKKKKKQTKI